MNRFGYILMSIFFAVAICGCEKQNAEVNDELFFQVANYATKAEKPYPTTESFGMYSYFTAGDFADAGAAWNSYPYMNNLKISYVEATVEDKTTTRWRPVDGSGNATPYFWPRAGKLNFIAYSPYKASNSNMSIVKDGDNLKVSLSGYTVSPTENQEDIMYSDFVPNQTSSGANGVPILFHHMLSKVQFKFKAADGTTIKPGTLVATINNIGTKGSYTSGQLVDESAIWTPASPAVNTTFDVNPEGASTQYTSLVAGPEWYVMPQELKASAQQLHVECEFVVTMDDVKNPGHTFDVEVPFEKTIDLREVRASFDPELKYYWNVNTIYIYNVTLSKAQHEIKFSVEATNWANGADVTLQ